MAVNALSGMEGVRARSPVGLLSCLAPPPLQPAVLERASAASTSSGVSPCVRAQDGEHRAVGLVQCRVCARIVLFCSSLFFLCIGALSAVLHCPILDDRSGREPVSGNKAARCVVGSPLFFFLSFTTTWCLDPSVFGITALVYDLELVLLQFPWERCFLGYIYDNGAAVKRCAKSEQFSQMTTDKSRRLSSVIALPLFSASETEEYMAGH